MRKRETNGMSISQKSLETNAKLKTFATFFLPSFRFFFKHCYLPNIFLAHRSVDCDYLASFLATNCLDDPDGTYQIDAVGFVRPKLLVVHFPAHLELRWTERLIIRHKPLLNLPSALVDHPTHGRKKENRKKCMRTKVKFV